MSNGQIKGFTPDDIDYDSEECPFKAFVLSPTTHCGDLSVPPIGAEQYLCRVMDEARKCPGVVVAANVNVNKKPQRCNQLPVMSEKMVCNTNLVPTEDWQISAMADFSKLRLRMDKLKQKMEHDPKFAIFANTLPGATDEESWMEKVLQEGSKSVIKPVVPSTHLCLAMSQVTIGYLLGLFRDWLIDKDINVQVGCRWVYCLLACLEQPILPNVYFTMRQIARTLINYRAQIDNLESEELPHINLLICIIARYFHQTDLADL